MGEGGCFGDQDLFAEKLRKNKWKEEKRKEIF